MQMKITLIIIGINSNVHFTIQPCFPNLVSLVAIGFYLFFPFPFFLFPLLAFLPPPLLFLLFLPSLYFLPSPSLLFFLPFSLLYERKKKMTPTLWPSLWSHRQPATSSSPLPVRGSRSQVQEGIIGLAGLVLLFIVFPWPIGSSANFSGLPQAAYRGLAPPPSPGLILPLYFHFSLLWLSLYKL